MKIRTREHYERMLANNPFTSIGYTLAAYMVVAGKSSEGLVDFDRDSSVVRLVAVALKKKYGETMSPDEVRHEMGK